MGFFSPGNSKQPELLKRDINNRSQSLDYRHKALVEDERHRCSFFLAMGGWEASYLGERNRREPSIKGGNILMEITAVILPSKGKLKHQAGYRDLPLHLGAVTLSPISLISVLSLLC